MSQAHTRVFLVTLVLSLFSLVTGMMMVAGIRNLWVSSTRKLDSNKPTSQSLSDQRKLLISVIEN